MSSLPAYPSFPMTPIETSKTQSPKERKRSSPGAAYACGIYLKRARTTDAARVERWKGDMDGILFFSGLFSAVVTAFLIESYKLLQVDNSATTVTLLTRVVARLEDVPVSTLGPDFPVNTNPSVAISMVINVLWFLSLIFSLNCALLGTLVQQWARQYSQNVNEDKPLSKLQHARSRAVFAEGAEKFRVSAFVAFIPLLLHIALALFFVGLIVFLFTVRPALAKVVLSVVCLTAFIYGVLTAGPAFVYSCPYRTPLSRPFRFLYSKFLVTQRVKSFHEHRRISKLSDSDDLRLYANILTVVTDTLDEERNLTNENVTHVFNAIPDMLERAREHGFSSTTVDFLRTILFSDHDLLHDLPRILRASVANIRELLSSYRNTPAAVRDQRTAVSKEAAQAHPCFRLLAFLAEFSIRYHDSSASDPMRLEILYNGICPCIDDAVALLQHRAFLDPQSNMPVTLPLMTARAACDCLVLLVWTVLLEFHTSLSTLDNMISSKNSYAPYSLQEASKNLIELAEILSKLLRSFMAVVVGRDLALPADSSLASLSATLTAAFATNTPVNSVATLLSPPFDSTSRTRELLRARGALCDVYLVVITRLALQHGTGDTGPVYSSASVLPALNTKPGTMSASSIYRNEMYVHEMLKTLLRVDVEIADVSGFYGRHAKKLAAQYLAW